MSGSLCRRGSWDPGKAVRKWLQAPSSPGPGGASESHTVGDGVRARTCGLTEQSPYLRHHPGSAKLPPPASPHVADPTHPRFLHPQPSHGRPITETDRMRGRGNGGDPGVRSGGAGGREHKHRDAAFPGTEMSWLQSKCPPTAALEYSRAHGRTRRDISLCWYTRPQVPGPCFRGLRA